MCDHSITWIKYRYEREPIRASLITGIFSEQKMNDLLHRFEFIRACTNRIWILTKGNRTDHLRRSEYNAERTEGKRDLNIILTNPFSEKIETEYLGFWVTTHDDVKPTNTK